MSILNIEIQSAEVHEKSGTSSKTGKPYRMREQVGYLDLNGERRRIAIGLKREQPPFEPGRYGLAESSFYVGKFGSLCISNEPVLVRLDAKSARAA